MTALSCALSQPREIPIVGAPKAADTLAVLAVARGGYDPFQVVALGDALAPAAVPLPQERTQIDGRAAAYVCVDCACQPR